VDEQLPPLEHQRGYFGPFMAAYGRASAATRARVAELVGLWHAGLLDGPHLIVRVSAELGIPAYTGRAG
jgi:hypothetical protein